MTKCNTICLEFLLFCSYSKFLGLQIKGKQMNPQKDLDGKLFLNPYK